MRLKTICFIFLHYLASSRCFSNQVNEKNEKKLDQNRLNAIKEVSVDEQFPEETNENETNIENAEEDYIFEKTNMSNSYGTDSSLLFETITYVTNSGYLVLKQLEDQVYKRLKLKQDSEIATMIQENVNTYNAAVEANSSFMLKQMVKCELEREFYILSFIDSVNRILKDRCLELLKRVIPESSVTGDFEDSVVDVMMFVEKAVRYEKKHNLAYICDKFYICRQFPACSDHIVDILNVITELPDTTFQILFIILNEITVRIAEFLIKIMDVDVAFTSDMVPKLYYLKKDNVTEARDVFITLKCIIKDRYQIFRSKNGDINLRKKALRILIDLFDKPFEDVDDRYIRKEVNTVKNIIRAWSKIGTIDIRKALKNFLINVLGELENFVLMPEISTEVKVLIDIIAKGSSKYMVMADRSLFTRGSRYINFGNGD